jgi:hypothetical protein
LAQGPEEKRGFAGRVAGVVVTISGILTDNRPSLGKGVPPQDLVLRQLKSNENPNSFKVARAKCFCGGLIA